MYKVIFIAVILLFGLSFAYSTKVDVADPFNAHIECIAGYKFLFVSINCTTCSRPLSVVQMLDNHGNAQQCTDN